MIITIKKLEIVQTSEPYQQKRQMDLNENVFLVDQDIAETLKLHKAKWHDRYRLQYNKTKLQRATKRKMPPEENADVPQKYTRRSPGKRSNEAEQCFFCGKPTSGSETLCHAATFGLDAHVRKCALQLQDQSLLAKLSAGDLIAPEAKYHAQCLVSLHNRARQTKSSKENRLMALPLIRAQH